MKFEPGTFSYSRRVAFCDTDAMGVVHHANYIRYFEEARVAWLRDRGLNHLHYPEADMCLAVLESNCQHFLSSRFDDMLKIYLQGRQDGLKIHLQYAIVRATEDQLIAVGKTVLVPVNQAMKPIKPPMQLREQLRKEPWTETWL